MAGMRTRGGNDDAIGVPMWPRCWQAMRDNGCQAVAIEASSHATRAIASRGRAVCRGGVYAISPGTTWTITRRWTPTRPPRRSCSNRSMRKPTAVVNDDDAFVESHDRELSIARSCVSASSKRADYGASKRAGHGAGFAVRMLHTPDGKADVADEADRQAQHRNALAAAALVGGSLPASRSTRSPPGLRRRRRRRTPGRPVECGSAVRRAGRLRAHG